ncbi:MAG: class I SAM-dependent methyltransferase, partial [Pseudomonadota bacterium]
MTADPQTLAFYDENAEDYARFASENAEHPRFKAFVAELREDARVLDFGCGTGWAAAALIEAGFAADAMDASAGLAEMAAKLYGLEVKIGAFRTLSRRARYDAIWCHFALQHAPREDRAQIFERMGTALKSSGLLYIASQKGPRDWRDDHGRLYCPFRDDELTELLLDAGFEEPELEFGTGKMYDGTSTLNVYVMARR